MFPDIEKLRALFDVLDERDIAEFEHEAEGVRLKIVRTQRAPIGLQAPGYAPQAPAAAEPERSIPPEDEATLVTSPFVGTFYGSPSPDAPTFVAVGSVVRPGQTLCIVEAMKLMNEIEAEFSGTVVECFVQNGKAVEFGQRLFRIKKA